MSNSEASNISHLRCYETDKEEELQQTCDCIHLIFFRVAKGRLGIRIRQKVSFDKIMAGKSGYSSLYE